MEDGNLASKAQTGDTIPSRRSVLALMVGVCRWLGAASQASAAAPETGGAGGQKSAAGANNSAGQNNSQPVRLAISESMVPGVNLNDARAAMLVWIQQMESWLQLRVDISPKVFETSAEIFSKLRGGMLDAVALNIVEYRQISEELDPSEVINESAGAEQYLLLVKRGGGTESLRDLRGRRLLMLSGARMCIAGQWLSTVLDEGHLGEPDQFFGSVVEDPKASRVVLPVFFGQAEACVTSKKNFDLICELNPQVAKELIPLATSPPLVVAFYMFRKNYRGAQRDRFARAYTSISSSVAGKQLATLFQFNSLTVRERSCLDPALSLLEKADRIRARSGATNRGGR